MITETEYGPCPVCGGNGQTQNPGGTALYITCTRCSGSGQIVTRTVTRQSSPSPAPAATPAQKPNERLAQKPNNDTHVAELLRLGERAALWFADGERTNEPLDTATAIKCIDGALGALEASPCVSAATLYTELQMQHARKQEHADGFIAGRGVVLKALGLDPDRRDDDELKTLIAGDKVALWNRAYEAGIKAQARVSAATPAPAANSRKCIDCGKPTGDDRYGICEACESGNPEFLSAAERPAPTCATCQHHNSEGPICKRGVGRPNSIVPSRRVDQFSFGCWLHEPAPASTVERPAPTWQERDNAPRDGRWFWAQSKHSNLITPMKWDESHKQWYSGFGWYSRDGAPFWMWQPMNVTEPLPAHPGPAQEDK